MKFYVIDINLVTFLLLHPLQLEMEAISIQYGIFLVTRVHNNTSKISLCLISILCLFCFVISALH